MSDVVDQKVEDDGDAAEKTLLLRKVGLLEQTITELQAEIKEKDEINFAIEERLSKMYRKNKAIKANIGDLIDNKAEEKTAEAKAEVERLSQIHREMEVHHGEEDTRLKQLLEAANEKRRHKHGLVLNLHKQFGEYTDLTVSALKKLGATVTEEELLTGKELLEAIDQLSPASSPRNP
jgi:hypothetical protein